jgi:hypothetical protein
MKLLIANIGLLLTLSVYAHMPDEKPISMRNASGISHTGFGNYGSTDFEAMSRLKVKCLDEDIQGYKQLLCDKNLVKNEKGQFSSTISIASESSFTINLRNYAANILSDEISGMPGSYDVNPRQCGGASNRLSPVPHKRARERARKTINAVSASLLMEQFGGDDNYVARLRRNYAYLFQPSAKWEELNDLIEDGNDDYSGLGDAYNDSGSDVFAHRNTMQAFESRYNIDKNFRQMIDTKVAEIQAGHESYLAAQLDKVCNFSPEQIKKTSPAIFDQYLVDLNEKDRVVANYYLCQQDFYYDASSFDSDCDGEVDEDDPAPADPFSPNRNYSIDEGIYDDPPFSDSTNYEIERGTGSGQNEVTISTDLTFDFADGISAKEKSEYLQFVKGCADNLERSLEAGASAWAAGRAGFKDKTIKFDFTLRETEFYESSSFDVHRCWCSTCKVRSDLGVFYDTYIPQDRCRADFSEEEVSALKDRNLNPNGASNPESNWFTQADAGNLIVKRRNPAKDCKTIKHEIMHQMGLPDEYTAGYYPFNLIGEEDSLMRSGEVIYDRHFGSLLSPRACSMEDGNRVL